MDGDNPFPHPETIRFPTVSLSSSCPSFVVHISSGWFMRCLRLLVGCLELRIGQPSTYCRGSHDFSFDVIVPLLMDAGSSDSGGRDGRRDGR
jgi:hypothetical protein